MIELIITIRLTEIREREGGRKAGGGSGRENKHNNFTPRLAVPALLRDLENLEQAIKVRDDSLRFAQKPRVYETYHTFQLNFCPFVPSTSRT